MGWLRKVFFKFVVAVVFLASACSALDTITSHNVKCFGDFNSERPFLSSQPDYYCYLIKLFKRAAEVKKRLKDYFPLKEFSSKGLVEIATHLPLEFSVFDCVSLIKQAYPQDVFDLYARRDLMFLNHLIIKEKMPSTDMRYLLRCIVGGFRAEYVSRGLEKANISAALYVKIFNFQDCYEVQSALQANVNKLNPKGKKPIKLKRKYALALCMPVRLPYDCCTDLILKLFPETMFHIFNKEERLLLTHLFPHKKHFWSDQASDTDKTVFTECLLGVMRSEAVDDYLSGSEIDMGQYLGLREWNESRIEHNRDAIMQIALEIYKSEGIMPDSAMTDSDPPDWLSVISGGTYRKITKAYGNSRIAAESNESVNNRLLRLPAGEAVSCIRSLFPQGMFHTFKGGEYMFMNILQPCGELNSEDRQFWSECLVGAYRSRYISNGLLNLPDCASFEFVSRNHKTKTE
ncbi:MAG: hypothetical protein LBO73_01075 [Holosporaceae bacterium]|jgi:hypothetical protein|nr:hypothetical protein [Holosporaceae bacterium]